MPRTMPDATDNTSSVNSVHRTCAGCRDSRGIPQWLHTRRSDLTFAISPQSRRRERTIGCAHRMCYARKGIDYVRPEHRDRQAWIRGIFGGDVETVMSLMDDT